MIKVDFKGTWVWTDIPDSKLKILRAGGNILILHCSDNLEVVITQTDSKAVTVKIGPDLVTVPLANVKAMDTSSIQSVPDMTNLAELHEGSLLHNIKVRYMTKDVYVCSTIIFELITDLRWFDPGSCQSLPSAQAV